MKASQLAGFFFGAIPAVHYIFWKASSLLKAGSFAKGCRFHLG
jgi:hypothetical protein